MTILLTVTVLLLSASPEAVPDGGLFRHSDVIAFTRGSLDDYRTYHVNFVSWGGYPAPDAKSIDAFRQGITVRMPAILVNGEAVRQARYVVAPRWPAKDAADGPRPPVAVTESLLPVTTRGDWLEIEVPCLDLWGILVLL